MKAKAKIRCHGRSKQGLERLQLPPMNALSEMELEFVNKTLLEPDEKILFHAKPGNIVFRDAKILLTRGEYTKKLMDFYLHTLAKSISENISILPVDFTNLVRGFVEDYTVPSGFCSKRRVCTLVRFSTRWVAFCADMRKHTLSIFDPKDRVEASEYNPVVQFLKKRQARSLPADLQWKVSFCEHSKNTVIIDHGTYALLGLGAMLTGRRVDVFIPHKSMKNYRNNLVYELTIYYASENPSPYYTPPVESLDTAVIYALHGLKKATAREILEKFLSENVTKKKKNEEQQLRNVYRSLARLIENGRVCKDDSGTKALYFLKQHAEHAIAPKHKTVCYYDPPRERQTLNIVDAFVSILHRYGALTTREVHNIILREGYCKRPPVFNSVNGAAQLLKKKYAAFYKRADGKHWIRNSVPLQFWIPDSVKDAVEKYTYKNQQRVLLTKEVQHRFLVVQETTLDCEKGVFARIYIGTGTLIEVPAVPSEKDNRYCFEITDEFNESSFVDCRGDSGNIPISEINDGGPSSVGELVLSSGRLFVLLRRSVSKGSELFATYNTEFTKHWNFEYPGDWKLPTDYKVVSRGEIRSAKALDI